MQTSDAMNSGHFHIVTPTIESSAMSKLLNTKVYLKLDNLQPSGSFKMRGLGHFCRKVATDGSKHLVCPSGGNAGLAAAYAAKKLGIPATIVVPQSCLANTLEKLKDQGATVDVVGRVWDDANQHAQKLIEKDGWVYVPPFDHPFIWEGNASIVTELKSVLTSKPGAIVLSVGGGGLLCGVIQGLHAVGWSDVPVVAMETKGADSLNATVKAGKLVSIPDITSIAKCLGAKKVCSMAWKNVQDYNVISEVITDEDAVRAMEQFLDDEKMLVQPACGAALASVYSGVIQRLQREGRLRQDLESLVVIVCGGSNMTLAQLLAYKRQFGLD
ncbi:L-serine dehydratase/L-threonine deaminase-like [Protopterus annectens]|uniref:L-serine dehydratase/L-threonine deaminase-like n=1 Tax=Protopterus annectens TaxID=7888 RepID=UPI001CFBF09B|nr:L-serine dehydratase/L-threonine deaminase-like [Protopterus annectens]XP_043924202.1 L-serine dehydratase/L-threonine deaminase-like [Protopterus annectens]XP_043924203.1 L-serine dehydratase/L-threonine deaminase-like [Protopterus annectens]